MRRLLAALLAAPTAAADSPTPPMALPGDAVAASARRRRAAPGSSAPARARRRARWRAASAPATSAPPAPAATWSPAPRARAFARALERRGLLVYAQPDTLAQPLQRAVAQTRCRCRPTTGATGSSTRRSRRRRSTADSPLIALVDAQLDTTHPEWPGGNTDAHRAVPGHRTRTAPRPPSVAAAPVNGVGDRRRLAGRARAQRAAAGGDHAARDSADADRAWRSSAGAAVINMSYGSQRALLRRSTSRCRSRSRSGIVPVAAAGNEFAEGNPLEFPASLPHVLTVAAVGRRRTSGARSSRTPTPRSTSPRPGERS